MSDPIRIAFVHYHLKRGGVTRVIDSSIQALKACGDSVEYVILTGETHPDFPHPDATVVIDGLNYSNMQEETPSPEVLVQRLSQAAELALGGKPDVWHIHNHSLGKNESMPGLVSLMAESGSRLLLQMHDFAEDGRPGNFLVNQKHPNFAGKVYPVASNVIYCVLNGRDKDVFSKAGLPDDRLNLLPNPVEVPSGGDRVTSPDTIRRSLGCERLFLYPVRAVRRKNFGEMLLWAALSEPGDHFITTLGPTNQNFQEQYLDWVNFAKENNLPVTFSVAELYDWRFSDIVEAASCILTTSIAEGFGLAFLEPALFQKPLAGRCLPEITRDFEDNGISFDSLYSSMPVPIGWIDVDKLKMKLSTALRSTYASYNLTLPDDAVEQALQGIQPSPGFIDFGGLDEALQKDVIRKVISDPALKQDLPVDQLIWNPCDESMQARIDEHYNMNQYGARLMDLYEKLMAPDVSPISYLSKASIVQTYLSPERFRLLRS
jgi:glycosyltransferase involved in cell wall biosynthesis